MSFSLVTAFVLLAVATPLVNGHAFFHTGFVNGVSQGHLFGVRAPVSNSPIEDVASSAIACNSPLYSPVSTDVIGVSPGDQFGMQWNHNIAGSTPGDADDPIAASHKGPVMVYMAKVNDASTDPGAGLQWFKVAEEGFNPATGIWGVDTLIANKGLWSFTMPDIAPGDYLLRGEILALHSAGSVAGAQFYMSCVGIRVSGSGTCSPSDTVSFPGAYDAKDPGILISIYGSTGKPDNAGKVYSIPGPKVIDCAKSSKPSTSGRATSKPIATSTLSSSNEISSDIGSRTISAKTFETQNSSSSKPTTFATITVSNTNIVGSMHPWESWTLQSPSPTSSPNTNSPVTISQSQDRSRSSKGPDSGIQNSQLYSRPVITKTQNASVAAVSSTSATEATPSSSDGTLDETYLPGVSNKEGTGYPFIGPSGKKFVCYEVVEA